jgi:glutamate synthase (NADPH/NADH) large chain
VGIHKDVVDLCLKGTVSRVSGASFEDFEDDQQQLLRFRLQPDAPDFARRPAQVRARRGIPRLQPGRGATAAKAVQNDDYQAYQQYADTVNTVR